MKMIAKRGLSLVLALVLCLGVLGGISLPEAEAASYTYNWGTRGDVADETDFTRSTAEEWYSKYNTSYAQLSALSGSATNSSVPSSALYTKLRSLMQGAASSTTSYDGTKSLFTYTDCENSSGNISSFYSGTNLGKSWNGSWNREHTWPNSKGDANGSGENDIFMLRPTATEENSKRGNEAYGEGGSYYNPNSESGGKYDLRGDVVRIMLFVYVRWQSISNGGGVLFGSDGVLENKEVMLKWLKEDPVDTWELGRNDACQSITGTRNVFVDYPELGFILFGADVPDNYTSPSGEGNAVSYNITATSNNTNYGTVSLSGKTITATPKTGYYVSGYTVTSGSATVTQSGNTFKVEAKSDCTVRINFAAKTAVTLTFMENGAKAKTINSYGGDSVTLPSNTHTVAEGYTFLGWTDGIVSDTTTKPTIYTAGTTVTASNKTYYAVYTYSVGGTGVTEWTLKDITEITAGDVFVITSATGSTVYALPNTEVSKAPTAEVVTASNGKLTSEPASNLLWNLGGSTNAWEFYPDGDTSRWLASINDNNGMSVGTGTNKAYKINSGYLYNNGVSRYVGVYTNNPDWRCYTSSSTNIGGQTLGFYVKSESGTVYYTTSTFVCDHEDTSTTAAVSATCTEIGYTAGVYCNDCEQYISGHEEVAALGHSWGSWVQTTAPTCTAAGVQTATCSRCSEPKTQSVAATGHSYSSVVTNPTATTQGYTTYTCTVCGYSYVGDYTDALGSTFYVSFSVPKGVEKVATMTCTQEGITLPTAAAPEGYKFEGWTTAVVEDTENKPTVLTGKYNAPSHIKLYAVYSYVESGTGGAGDYVKVTSAPSDWSGQYVIVYESGPYVLDSTLTTLDAKGNHKTVEITDNSIPAADGDKYAVTIEKTGDKYSIKTISGYYIGATGNANSLNSSETTVYTNTLSMNTDGSVNVIGSGGAYLRFNSDGSRFRYYKSSSYTGQKAIALYAKGEASTTYYTTLTTVDPVASVGDETYTSFQEAYAAANTTDVITLWDDVEMENWTLTKDVTIDLNGFYMLAVVTAVQNDAVIYGLDNGTTNYEVEEWGALMISGATVKAAEGYLAIAEDAETYSFHAYELEITHISLDPANDALGYKVQLLGDYLVLESVTEFGFHLRVDGGQVKTWKKTGANADGIFTLRLKGIMAANGGEKDITATAFVVVAGEDLATQEQTTSMKQTIEAVNDMTTLSAAQKAAVYGLYVQYKDQMEQWLAECEKNNIQSWA